MEFILMYGGSKIVPASRLSGADLSEFLVSVRRVSTVVKGGRRFSFSVMVVVGDGRGHVGFASGRHSGVAEAKQKAVASAKRNMRKVHLRAGRTLHHDIEASFCSVKVKLRLAKAGTGIIAGGAMRAIFTALGIRDVVAKVMGASSNPYNIVRAVFRAFDNMYYPKQVADKRGKKVSEIVENRA